MHLNTNWLHAKDKTLTVYVKLSSFYCSNTVTLEAKLQKSENGVSKSIIHVKKNANLQLYWAYSDRGTGLVKKGV